MLARRLEEEYELYEEVPQSQPLPQPRRRVCLNTQLRAKCCILFVTVSAMAMLVTFLSGLSASRGYALVQTKQEALSLESENERLRLEVAKLKAPQRVQQLAASELGMVVSKNVYFAAEKP